MAHAAALAPDGDGQPAQRNVLAVYRPDGFYGDDQFGAAGGAARAGFGDLGDHAFGNTARGDDDLSIDGDVGAHHALDYVADLGIIGADRLVEGQGYWRAGTEGDDEVVVIGQNI
mgnify:CR=1 FL=1